MTIPNDFDDLPTMYGLEDDEHDIPDRMLGKVVGDPPKEHDFIADCYENPDLAPPVYNRPFDRVAMSAGGVEYRMLPSQARRLADRLLEAADWVEAPADVQSSRDSES